MGTWIKETDKAIYLMQGNSWLSRITKYPSDNNPKEQVVDVTGMESWFLRSDAPTAMTISLGTGAPEPDQWVAPPPPEPAGKTNDSGIEIIKTFEGLRTTAYQDSVGVWTIGYGHTSMAGPPTVYAGMTITAAEAEEILRQDLNIFEAGVEDALTISTNSDQFSAMVSFSFNVGLQAYRDSTLLRKHNAGDFPGAADEFLRWVYAGGEVLPGLQRRRQAERALYLSQDYSPYL
jgi:GH24 family phage-related lysozyme (muramidase)